MKKIIVTGGAGFIGSHTVIELVHAGFEPIIVDNFENSTKEVLVGIKNILGREVKCYPVDCNDIQAMDKVFANEAPISGLIHFAANKAVGESVKNPLKYYRNNLGSLVTMLELMKKHEVKDFVFSSSCTVYGEPDHLPVTELTPIKVAQSPYGNSKQISEEIITDFINSGSPFKAIILRYFNPIGAHPSAEIGELPIGVPSNLIPFITQSAAGLRPPVVVHGNTYSTPDGTCIRDYIHVVDLAKAHVKSLEKLANISKNSYLDFFNLGTGNGNSVLEVIQTFEKVNDLKLEYKIGARREGDVEKIYASTDKATKELDWKTELSLGQALKDSWKWQQKITSKKEVYEN